MHSVTDVTDAEVTLDTTVLARAIFPPRRRKEDTIYAEQLRLHTVAKPIIKSVEDNLVVMHIPSVAIVEIAAIGARLTGKEERGIQASDYLKSHGNVLYDDILLDKAVKTAAETKTSGFDSVFIACAMLTNSVLITDDKKMHEAAIKVGIQSKLLRDMR